MSMLLDDIWESCMPILDKSNQAWLNVSRLQLDLDREHDICAKSLQIILDKLNIELKSLNKSSITLDPIVEKSKIKGIIVRYRDDGGWHEEIYTG